jgi:hypothetical protein
MKVIPASAENTAGIKLTSMAKGAPNTKPEVLKPWTGTCCSDNMQRRVGAHLWCCHEMTQHKHKHQHKRVQQRTWLQDDPGKHVCGFKMVPQVGPIISGRRSAPWHC